ncbi:MAG: glycoside hydrolase family 25 [Frankiales bacterium]|nr:glycoside hydrolase family 25 [Frankiales bacterium]
MRTRLIPLLVLAALLPVLAPHGAQAASGRVQGIDTAKYQHDGGRAIDWNAVRGSGQRFAFIKATGHADKTDPWFARDWAAAGRAGMIRGAYHYADPSSSAVAQADAIVNVVGSTREAGDLGIVLDLESTGGRSPSALAAWAHAFLNRVESRTGRLPILYTYVSFWSGPMANNRSFGAYPLWLARYGAEPRPLAGWNRWTFWQHTSSARVSGIVGAVDHDVLCCSAGTLAALADGRTPAITRLWHRLGGASGALGLPTGPEAAVPGGWGQAFEHGYVASTSVHGTWAVLSPIWERYSSVRGAAGPLGVPVAAAAEPVPGVVSQQFTGGLILWSRLTGAQPLLGAMLHRWRKDGGVRSQEGLPTGPRVGVAQQFRGGGLYATSTGVHLVPGAIRDRYESLGGPSSVLGLPASEATAFHGGRLVSFDLGTLIELTVGGHTVVV